jgi:hypothetical protein
MIDKMTDGDGDSKQTKVMNPWQLKKLVKNLAKVFGLEYLSVFSPDRAQAKGIIGGYDVFVRGIGPGRFSAQRQAGSPASTADQSRLPGSVKQAPVITALDTEFLLEVQLKTPVLLPLSLEIVTSGVVSPYHPSYNGRLCLDIADLPGLNQIMGKDAFDEGVAADLRALKQYSYLYFIHRKGATILILCETATIETLRETMATMIRLASRLFAINREVDIYLPALYYRLFQPSGVFDRKECLRQLGEHYRDHPLARQAFWRLLSFNDFEIALLAVEQLGLDPVEYINGRIGKLDPADQAEALCWLCEKNVPDGVVYVIDFFKKTLSIRLKSELIEMLSFTPQRLGNEVFLAGLHDSSLEVKTVAVKALTRHGGEDALGALYAIGNDGSLPAELRRRANLAAAAIQGDKKARSDGQLSLAGDTAGEGGLSMAGDAPDNSPSPEKPKH